MGQQYAGARFLKRRGLQGGDSPLSRTNFLRLAGPHKFPTNQPQAELAAAKAQPYSSIRAAPTYDRAMSGMRCAIVLGEGKYPDEFSGYSNEEGPRLEFIELAKALDADVMSYTSAAANRGGLFRTLFSSNQKIGSAVNAAMVAKNYDRIYVTAEGVGLPLAILLKTLNWKGKLTCVFHNMSWPSKQRAVSILGHDIFSAFITVSEAQASILSDDCGMPTEKVMAVYNWVDEQFFRPDVEIETPSTPFVMSCGAENRDYETLARAARGVSMRFAIYGHGYRAANLKAQDTPPNVEYMPRVSYGALRDAYAASTIVVVPLNDVDYAAGVTGIVEAMAAGKPIIATASRGVREYLTSFEPETVVPAGDDKALAAAIVRMSADVDAQRMSGSHNRTFAEAKCAVDAYANAVKNRMLER